MASWISGDQGPAKLKRESNHCRWEQEPKQASQRGDLHACSAGWRWIVVQPGEVRPDKGQAHECLWLRPSWDDSVKNLPAMRETWVRSLGWKDPLATHSSFLAWRIPWKEKPGRLKSMGSQRVGYDWATFAFQFTYYVKPILWASQVVLVVKNPPTNAGDARDMGSIPGPRRSPGVGNDNPFQYSCLEKPMDRWAWRATVQGLQKVRQDWATSTWDD